MSVKLALLRAAARRPLLALGVAALGVAAPVALGAALASRSAPAPLAVCDRATDPRSRSVDAADEIDPRAILGRAWFDKYPEKRTDSINFLVFFGGGFGIHDVGSAYRSTIDVFEFERQKDRIIGTHLHDKKAIDTRFKITKCDDDPPFNVCLDLDASPGGPKRYHGFWHEDEMDAAIPWGRALVTAAQDRARAK